MEKFPLAQRLVLSEVRCQWFQHVRPRLVVVECRCGKGGRHARLQPACLHTRQYLRRKILVQHFRAGTFFAIGKFLRDRAYGASVGGATMRSLSFKPEEIATSLWSETITPSTSGSRSTSAMPSCVPRMNTPVESPSAITARLVTIVTLRAPRAGSPVAGSSMW